MFGVFITLPHNRAIYERFSEGIKNRAVFDNPQMSLKAVFTKLANGFNNDNYVITLPSNATDVEGWDSMDANDHSRICINRDCKSHILFIPSPYLLYK